VDKQAVPEDRAKLPSLSDPEIKAITLLAKVAERHYGCPQDIEWAVDLDLPDGENVILLQSRPETVWSRQKSHSKPKHADNIASIVSTLMSPLYSRDKAVGTAEDSGRLTAGPAVG
jgi:pyruvate,water dikinase